jgi:hypothetical protein
VGVEFKRRNHAGVLRDTALTYLTMRETELKTRLKFENTGYQGRLYIGIHWRNGGINVRMSGPKNRPKSRTSNTSSLILAWASYCVRGTCKTEVEITFNQTPIYCTHRHQTPAPAASLACFPR